MSEPSLKSEIWIKAQIRICDLNFIPAAITRRGNSDAGAILLKLNRLDAGVEVFSQVRDAEGRRAWLRGTGDTLISDQAAEAYIEKQLKYDPDLWVLEIEDPKSEYSLDGKIL